MTEPSDTRADEYRARLIAGMVEAIAEVGYADLTIADVVRRARASKRTFYEHFESKEACLLAVHEAESGRLLDEIESAIRETTPGEGRAAVGVGVYLASLQRRPWLLRSLLIEILHLGAPGLAIRRRVMQRFAELLVREYRAAGTRTSTAVAMAIVGGINELVLEAVEEDRVGHLDELAGPVEELMRGVLRGPGRAAK